MKNQIEVPKEALSLRQLGGEGEVFPEKGDPVDFHVEGTIRKVNEGWCLVDVKFINGKRPGPPEREFIPEVSDQEDDLRSLAENADAAMEY
jgi:hypothetical protein